MTSDKRGFEATVRGAERFARESPQAYQIAVAALASLGYVFITVVISASLALLGGLIFGMFSMVTVLKQSPAAAINLGRVVVPVLLAVFGFLGSVLKSLWVKIPAPEGPELTRETAGRLFLFLDDISKSLRAPRFNTLLLSDDFTAAVVQVPMFGIMGPTRNYLILGLPLMKALTREQFRAVVAHELGHISGNHSRFAGWIYRQRTTWLNILTEVRHNWVFTPFLSWYAPYFFAYTFVLARSDEFIADKCGAELAGAGVMAEALVATVLQRRYLEEKLWPSILSQCEYEHSPVGSPFSTMFRFDKVAGPAPDEATTWLMQAYMERTQVDDTHPSLADRLSALGFRGVPAGPLDPPKPPLPPPPPMEKSAADELLGPYNDRLSAVMDAEWRKSITPAWREGHTEARRQRQRFDLLGETISSRSLSLDEMCELVHLVERFEGLQAAVPHARALSQQQLRSAKAQAIAGLVLLRSGDTAGIPILESAGALDPAIRHSTHTAIVELLKSQGKFLEAHKYDLRSKDPLRR